jgi:membrane-associated phospholipid phosphatase
MNISSDFVNRSAQGNHRGWFASLTAPTKQGTRIILTAGIGVVVVILFGLMIRNTHFDLAVVQHLNNLHHGKVGSLTNAVYKFFGPTFAILGTVLLTAIIIFLTKSLRVGSTFAATVAATWLSLAVVKLLVHRVRPDPTLLNFPFNPAQIDASYPSGHAAFVTALVVTIVLGVAVGRRRWVTAIIGGLLIIGVGTALVINGVHYPSDVIGSIIWGITVAPLARYVWVSVVLRRLTPSNLKTQQ